MNSPKQEMIKLLDIIDDTTSWEDLKKIIDVLNPAGKLSADWENENLYQGRIRKLITLVGIIAIILVIGSIYVVTFSKLWAVIAYSFWAIAPPTWFFIEWVWLFDSRGDSRRLDKFKITIDLAQKFWAAVLVLLAIEILLKYNMKP